MSKYYNQETLEENLNSATEELYCITKDIIKFEGENRKMRTEQIVDLWYERCLENIYTYYAEKEGQIIDNDTINQKIKKTISELDEDLKEYEMTIFDKLPISILNSMTKESKLKIEKIYHEKEQTVKDLRELAREIRTMISACETYEQEIEVLKTYSVISTLGKMTPRDYSFLKECFEKGRY